MTHRIMRKVLRTDLKLESCSPLDMHEKGCYIRFTKKKYHQSKQRNDCIVDYDKEGNVIGIEFYDGL